jgi:selenide,water dikinase
MLTLNADAAQAMVEVGVSAATDITGFGLLGHAGEMMQASGVGFALDAVSIPLFDGVLDLIRNDCVPSGTKDNAAAHAEFTRFAEHIDPALRMALSDAQTSGGLLISVPRENAKKLVATIGPSAHIIGVVLTGDGISVG